jgi:hypothetical protein
MVWTHHRQVPTTTIAAAMITIGLGNSHSEEHVLEHLVLLLIIINIILDNIINIIPNTLHQRRHLSIIHSLVGRKASEDITE